MLIDDEIGGYTISIITNNNHKVNYHFKDKIDAETGYDYLVSKANDDKENHINIVFIDHYSGGITKRYDNTECLN